MAFSEKLKTQIRKQSDFRCCLCHNIGVEIHHIVPMRDGGSDSAENAAPLCPSCHDLFGANPEKRRFIREARDSWFEILDQRNQDELQIWGNISALIEELPTKEDLQRVKTEISDAISEDKPDEPILDEESASIGDILQFIYNLEDDSIRESDIDFLFEFAFGGEIEHKEFELTKNFFVEAFGIESAKQLCGWVLQDHPFRPSSPFTTEHLHRYINDLFNALILFVSHEDVSPVRPALGAFIAKGGSDIYWYAARDEQVAKPDANAS